MEVYCLKLLEYAFYVSSPEIVAEIPDKVRLHQELSWQAEPQF